MKFINIIELKRRRKHRTKYFILTSKKNGSKLGEIKWHTGWRCYALFPEPNTFFNDYCLEGIIRFIWDLKNERELKKTKVI